MMSSITLILFYEPMQNARHDDPEVASIIDPSSTNWKSYCQDREWITTRLDDGELIGQYNKCDHEG